MATLLYSEVILFYIYRDVNNGAFHCLILEEVRQRLDSPKLQQYPLFNKTHKKYILHCISIHCIKTICIEKNPVTANRLINQTMNYFQNKCTLYGEKKILMNCDYSVRSNELSRYQCQTPPFIEGLGINNMLI